MYLVEGSNKAALIDTGTGVGNLSEHVKENSSAAYKDLTEGTVFELGGVTLEIYNAAGHTLDINTYEKSMKDLLSKTDGKFDKIILSHGTGDAPKELLNNIIELCEEIKAGKSDDVPFDFMGQRAYIAKRANEKFERVDEGFGNIIYS